MGEPLQIPGAIVGARSEVVAMTRAPVFGITLDCDAQVLAAFGIA
ncbi:hypothetical protein N798_01130 [Knoellia flava TL1]|uniref:Uncharacterized protein n=1 Tax=Knoellia flava TL1 TaxID=1385518 RepID=A0ABR4XJA6_9MICO|nr:hypothetical protein N798_01130 [Knoellia flava TL1]